MFKGHSRSVLCIQGKSDTENGPEKKIDVDPLLPFLTRSKLVPKRIYQYLTPLNRSNT